MVFLSVLLSLILCMKIQVSASFLLIQFCLCLQMLIKFFNEIFGLSTKTWKYFCCFSFPNKMSFSENLCMQLHTAGEKLKLSFLPWMWPQCCVNQHTTFSAVPSISPSVSWKSWELCGNSLVVSERPEALSWSWGCEMLWKCCNWGISSFKLGDELWADIKQALSSGCLLEQLRKESCIKTLGGGKCSAKW